MQWAREMLYSMLMRRLSLLLLLSVSCYHPGIASGTFTCDQPGDICPDGQVCAGGLCVNPGDVPDGATLSDLAVGGPADLTGSSPADLTGGGPADLTMSAPADLTAPPDPCAAGWTEVVPASIYACRRTFTVTGGNFDNLCRTGYHVCSAADDVSGAESSPGSDKCNAAGGFYTTQLNIAVHNVDTDHTADGICTPQMSDTDRALLGCGSDNGLYRLNRPGCNTLRTTLRCSSAPTGWTCTSAQQITHTSSTGGVLCCVNK